jgi:hypothetical protein
MSRDNGKTVLVSIAGATILVLLGVAGSLLSNDRALLEKRDAEFAARDTEHERVLAEHEAQLRAIKATQDEMLAILRRLDEQRKANDKKGKS